MKTILLYPMNGIGLGHLHKLWLLAGNLRSPKTKIILVTNSPVPEIFGKFYDHCVKLPYFSKKILLDKKKYNQFMMANSRKFVQVVKKYKPGLIIGDFNVYADFLFIPFMKAVAVFPVPTLYLWSVGDRTEFFERWNSTQSKLKYFDKIIFPYDKREFADMMPTIFIKKINRNKKYAIAGPICKTTEAKGVRVCRRKYHIGRNDFLITVSLGGGGGLPELDCEFPDKIIDSFLTIYPSLRRQIPNIKVIIFTGPFYRGKLKISDKSPELIIVAFEKNFQEILALSKMVITAAGYNTCNEIIMTKTPSILIPLLRANQRQFERASYFARLGVAKTLKNPTPPSLFKKIIEGKKDLRDMKKNFSNFSNFEPGNKKIAAIARKITV